MQLEKTEIKQKIIRMEENLQEMQMEKNRLQKEVNILQEEKKHLEKGLERFGAAKDSNMQNENKNGGRL